MAQPKAGPAARSPARKPAKRIVLPHQWRPYPWQRRVLEAFKAGKKRFLLVVHRRAGKDQIGLNLAAIASQLRVGLYCHVFPTEKANRGAIWKGMDKRDGRRFIDQAFPHELRAATREHTMEIEFTNGSLWKCIGSDNYDALRGSNGLGYVFSEYAFADPQSWTSIVAPILRENGGWAMFISTPNGKNHFWELYQVALANPDIWHVEYLTVDDTCDESGRPLMTAEDIEKARIEDGLSDADVRREFYCDWNSVFTGAYYANELEMMRKQGRITKVDYDPKRPVYCSWDLGQSDELVALFLQKNGSAHYCIGSRSWTHSKYEDVLGEIEDVFPWGSRITKHILPHDANKGSGQTGTTDAQMFEQLGCEIEVMERALVLPGIQATRALFPTLWIDNEVRPWSDGRPNNERLIEAIGGYRTSQSQQQKRLGVHSVTPLHSWESHWCDALRYYAVAERSGALAITQWGPDPNAIMKARPVI